MTNKLIHSAALLAMVLLGTQGQLLGQATPAVASAVPKRPLTILHSMEVPSKPPPATRPSGSQSEADGDIVGFYAAPAATHGFLLSGGVYRSIDFPLTTFTRAQGINDAGEIAGWFIDTNSLVHGFTFARGAFNQIDVAGASGTEIHRIKNNGNVVGLYLDGRIEAHGIIGR